MAFHEGGMGILSIFLKKGPPPPYFLKDNLLRRVFITLREQMPWVKQKLEKVSAQAGLVFVIFT